MDADSDTHRTIRAIFTLESPKLIARLARMVRDVGLAEELAQDALVIALERWPASGVPDNPAAWLMTTAKHRALNAIARGKLADKKVAELGHEPAPPELDLAAALDDDDDVGDELLRLVFVACHPVLSPEARVALTLRLLGGLTTDEIARAFLVPESTIAQRIVRAKKALHGVPFELPRAAERAERTASVLAVIYLIFNEGYAASAGDDVMRPALCVEALRLGRVLANLAPDDPEVHGLVALMELHQSRAAARHGGEVLLLEQNRGLWDGWLVERGLAALARAESLSPRRGPYAIQAAISACHARARVAEQTDWQAIAALYGELGAIAPSPIVELNRAVAVAMADGPAAGLALVDALAGDPTLRGYHRLPAVRGDLLVRLGRRDEARREFVRAAALAHNTREREQLVALAAGLM